MLGGMMDKPLLISALIEHAERFHADTEIVSRETTGQINRTNWKEVGIQSRQLASALGGLQLSDNARLGTLAWNNHRHLKIWFGAAGAGYVVHTLNPRLFPEQLVFIVNDATDEALFFDKTFLPLVKATRDKLPSLRYFIYLGTEDKEVEAAIPDVIYFDDLVAKGDKNYQWPEFDERTAHALCYTSGTTGNPKGVLYHHRSTMLHSFAAGLPDTLSISAREIVLPVVPMFHANAWGIPYAAAMVGAKLVMPGPGLDGDSLLELIEKERVSVALGVPTIWQMLLASAAKKPEAMKSLSRTVIGGSACPPAMFAAFRDLYQCDVVHAWGMTETSPLGSSNVPKTKHLSLSPNEFEQLRVTQGRPPFGVDLRLVDEEGNLCPHDGQTRGALQIKGYWIVERYYGKPTTALTPDGWFDTGDVASIDEDGFITIRDRTKDMIKSGGEWISSVELENLAVAHPGIKMAGAIAAAHPKWDERPIIIAVKAEGQNPSEAEIIQFFADKVAKWQIPDRVIFVEALPLTGSGKILKTKLREQYHNVLLDGK